MHRPRIIINAPNPLPVEGVGLDADAISHKGARLPASRAIHGSPSACRSAKKSWRSLISVAAGSWPNRVLSVGFPNSVDQAVSPIPTIEQRSANQTTCTNSSVMRNHISAAANANTAVLHHLAKREETIRSRRLHTRHRGTGLIRSISRKEESHTGQHFQIPQSPTGTMEAGSDCGGRYGS
ncbi:hypothetical protein Enr13x_09550 [Stieleria neptunia]|uniref:Uncharacterized protein n=1 Tax=Stieleria neptunia TaxID=2527979 RepID=A0A518HJU1_9BACT|nr:hypothetical protein Enr13x_09550 [Stieleria neptunia]